MYQRRKGRLTTVSVSKILDSSTFYISCNISYIWLPYFVYVGTMIDPVLLVHGGAGDIPDWRVTQKLSGVQKAAKAGYQVLSKPGGSVLDAVEIAVNVMEDDEAFNAGVYMLIQLNAPNHN